MGVAELSPASGLRVEVGTRRHRSRPHSPRGRLPNPKPAPLDPHGEGNLLDLALASHFNPISMLTIANVSKSYGPRTLFAEVSLSIARNDRLGLVGANGAGKSTLFNLILG